MKIIKNYQIADKTFFRVGGEVNYFVEIENLSELNQLHDEIVDFDKLPKLVVGACSNILVSDRGFDGVIIKNSIRKVDFGDENQVVIGAGELLPKVSYELAKRGLAGLEHLANIPGTVGGGIRGNVEAYEQSISEKLVMVKWCDFAGNCRNIVKADCGFEYRESKFKREWNGQGMIVEALFQFDKGDANKLLEIMELDRNKRNDSQPKDWSCGCFFKNVYLDQQNMDLLVKKWGQEVLLDRKMGDYFSAGVLIDKVGLKGMKLGGAQVSPIHANFIINSGGASAMDIFKLFKAVQEKVLEETKINLENEVQIVGDFS